MKCTPEAKQLVIQLATLPENALCADCQANVSKYTSSNIGIFICYQCSAIHKSLGSQISFVRAIALDNWTPEQSRLMKRVGNKVANEYYEKNLPADFVRPSAFDTPSMEQFIRQKYIEKRWADSGEPPQNKKTRYISASRSMISASSPQLSDILNAPPRQLNILPGKGPATADYLNARRQRRVVQIGSEKPLGSDSTNEPKNEEKNDPPKQEGEKPSASDSTNSTPEKKENTPTTQEKTEKIEKSDNQANQQKPQPTEKTTTQAKSTENTTAQQEKSTQPADINETNRQPVALNSKSKANTNKFIKKPTGDQVLEKMIRANNSPRPASAPVKPKYAADVASLFANLDFSQAKH